MSEIFPVKQAKPGMVVETIGANRYTITTYQDMPGKIRAYGIGQAIVHLHTETLVTEVTE